MKITRYAWEVFYDEARAQKARADAAEHALTQLQDVLERVEWSGRLGRCPSCARETQDGHADHCRLATVTGSSAKPVFTVYDLTDASLVDMERSSAAEAASLLLTALGWTSGGLGSAAHEVVGRWQKAEAELTEVRQQLTVATAEKEALQETLTVCEHEVAKVYDHITRGRISKMNTLATCVIGEADDIVSADVDEATKELEARVADLEAQLTVATAERDKLRDFVRDVAGWSILICDHDHERDAIQRARELIGTDGSPPQGQGFPQKEHER